ncbi:galactose mutarotase-like protein [Peniophora sp. CONT]|nr:galactose mutarotase-like protein [Peniophora sp. CONT]
MSDPHARFVPIRLELPSSKPALAVEVLPHGMTLQSILLTVDGKTHDILIGPEQPTGHETLKYTNNIIGRYTNRVPTAERTISKGGIQTTIAPHPHPPATPHMAVHGGPSGFDQLVFTPTESSPPGALFTAAEITELQARFPQNAGMHFRAISPDGDQGYPGALLVESIVGLLQPEGKPEEGKEPTAGSVVLVYRAALLSKNVVTPVNLTQHWGFTLDASLTDKYGPEALNIKGHRLTIQAPYICEVDATKMPTGKLISTEGTAHAHKNKVIADDFPAPGGYDNFYVFDKRSAHTKHFIPRSEFKPESNLLADALVPGAADGVVELASDKSGIHLVFGSNQGGVQLYSHNIPKETGGVKRAHGGTGKEIGYPAYSGVFLEFHEPLASFVYPDAYPGKNDTILTPDEIYNSYTRMDVLYKASAGQ